VASAGDFNGDGLDDVIVGARSGGSAFIFFGGQTGTINDPDTNANVVLNGQGGGGEFGNSVASAGDFNGDGLDDVIVGARLNDSSGSAYIFFGGQTGTINDPDTNADVVLNGEGPDRNEFGNYVASAGDFNGDGLDDVIVGAPEDDNNSLDNSGSAFIFFSPFSSPTSNDVVTNIPGTGVSVLLNDNTSSVLLHADTAEAIAVADVDGNGVDDVIVSFPPATGPDGNGGTYISRNEGPLVSLIPQTAEQIVAGDFDGSGQDDLFLDFGVGVGLASYMNDTVVALLTPQSPLTMAVGDVDNSGADDVVLSFTAFGTVLFLNFSTVSILDASPADVLALGDIDGNGEDDIVAVFAPGNGPGGTGGLFIARNQGPLTSLTTLQAAQVIAGDFDGSGQDDLVLDFGGATGLWIYLNDASVQFLTLLSPVAMAAGDMDSSGQDDIIFAFDGVGTLAFKNLTTVDMLDPVGVALDLATGNMDGN